MAGTRPLKPAEEASVLAALEAYPARHQCLVVLMLNCGYRVTETIGLTLGDVWSEGRIRARITVNRGRLKGGKSCRRRSIRTRSVPLNAKASAVLEKYLFARFGSSGPTDLDAPLFPGRYPGTRLSRWAANDMVKAVLGAAGLEVVGGTGQYGTHSLRKTYCQKVYRASGYNLLLVRDSIGHRSVACTELYLSVEAEDVDRVILKLGEEKPNLVQNESKVEGVISTAAGG